MRYFLFFLFLILFQKFGKAQDFSLNQGGTNQENYFSVIKFENFYGFIIVSVTIKGENYRFLLDTGAPNCVSKALQQKLNYKILERMPISDVNGVTDSMTVLSMDELVFGGVTFNNTPALILDNPSFIDCMKIDGVIGSNMLRNSIVRFSYADSSITLTDNINKLNLSEKYASEMTLHPIQSNPYIDINIIGEEEGQEKLLFDTGFTGFYDLSDRNYQLFKEYPIFNIEAEGFGRSAIGFHGNGEDFKIYRLRLPTMELNGVFFQNVTTETSTGDNSIIGHDILKYGNATVDYKNKKFYFEPFKNNVDLTEKHFSITPRVDENKIFVGIIWDNALKDRVEIGDQIIAIDALNCEHIDACDVFKPNFIFSDKDKITLKIRDKTGKVKDIKIEKK
jgi:hypothetical protein